MDILVYKDVKETNNIKCTLMFLPRIVVIDILEDWIIGKQIKHNYFILQKWILKILEDEKDLFYSSTIENI